MKPQPLSPEGIQALDDLVQRVYHDLSDTENTHFFTTGQAEQTDPTTGAVQVVNAILDTVAENRQIIDSITGSSVVYAIWVRTPSTGESVIRYIGHVVGTGARTRLINHFVRKHPRTGAQLDNVRAALKNGDEVGVSFVDIDPPALRLYVEDVLIRDKRPVWNIQGAEHRSKKVPL